jgi:chromosome segregation ATPase
MTVIEDEEQQEQQLTPTIETLKQKIDELANTVDELHTFHYLYESRTKTIMKQIREARQLALDLNIDEIQLRKMISQSFAKAGVSESW